MLKILLPIAKHLERLLSNGLLARCSACSVFMVHHEYFFPARHSNQRTEIKKYVRKMQVKFATRTGQLLGMTCYSWRKEKTGNLNKVERGGGLKCNIAIGCGKWYHGEQVAKGQFQANYETQKLAEIFYHFHSGVGTPECIFSGGGGGG